MTANVIEIIYKVTGDGKVVSSSKKIGDEFDKTDRKAKRQKTSFDQLAKAYGALAIGIGTAVAEGSALISWQVENIKMAGVLHPPERQLAQTIASTGGAARLTTFELQQMASGLQNITTFGDEAIMGGQSLLLTFKNIGRDVFPQATETMLDMSQALGQDMKSSAIQLGKALNDPITGVTALQRVGVSFTEDQREQIEVLVESGQTMEAQKIILDELSSQFGGSAAAAAETYTGQITQLSNTFGDLREQIGFAMRGSEENLALGGRILNDVTARVTVYNKLRDAVADGNITRLEMHQTMNQMKLGIVSATDIIAEFAAEEEEAAARTLEMTIRSEEQTRVMEEFNAVHDDTIINQQTGS
jgi:phage-related minor tail protein